jgi:hypothetical protein
MAESEVEKPKQASRLLEFGKIIVATLIGASAGAFKEDPHLAVVAFESILVFGLLIALIYKFPCIVRVMRKKPKDVGVK